jgi:hypothetical protein
VDLRRSCGSESSRDATYSHDTKVALLPQLARDTRLPPMVRGSTIGKLCGSAGTSPLRCRCVGNALSSR